MRNMYKGCHNNHWHSETYLQENYIFWGLVIVLLSSAPVNNVKMSRNNEFNLKSLYIVYISDSVKYTGPCDVNLEKIWWNIVCWRNVIISPAGSIQFTYINTNHVAVCRGKAGLRTNSTFIYMFFLTRWWHRNNARSTATLQSTNI